jgi:hypothetical protein
VIEAGEEKDPSADDAAEELIEVLRKYLH